MKTLQLRAGLISLCLLPLSACTSTLPLPAPAIIVNSCATPTPCSLPAAKPLTNRDLLAQLDERAEAWALCADKVDQVIKCHAKAAVSNEKAH